MRAKRELEKHKDQHRLDSNRQTLVDGEANGTINHHILATALRFIPGGRATFVGYVQRAFRNGDKAATSWWRVFSDLKPVHQQRVDLDDICEAAGVPPDEIMAVVVSAAMKMGQDVADLTAAIFHPKIVQKTAESALRITGDHAAIALRDREFMLQHGKFIAGPKGTVVNVSASARAAAAAQSEPSVPTFSESLSGAVAGQREATQAVIDGTVAED